MQEGLMGALRGAFGYVVALVPVDVLGKGFVQAVVNCERGDGRVVENKEILSW